MTEIARFANEIKAERVMCLTATATPRVAKDICEAFNVDEAGLFRTTTYRPNLRLLAESAMTKQELYPRLFLFLRKHPGATIVYVTLQKQTEALADDLRDQGFKARAFHAGMETAKKTELQDDFMTCNDMIIVATIAFGMGIDKASIRNVVHFNIPSNLESYSQEVGRAGRDGVESNCLFYVCGEDLHLREMFARKDLPSRDSVRNLLQDIFDPSTILLPVGSEFKKVLSGQEREFDIQSNTLKNVYAQLELAHGLIRMGSPSYTKYTFKPGALYMSYLTSDHSPAAQAIATFSKCKSTLFHLNLDLAAAQTGVPRFDIVRKLNDLHETQVIDLRVGGIVNGYKIVKSLPKTADEIENLVTAIYSGMEEREQEAFDRTEEMLKLITSKACFSRSLARHFGDDLPDSREECEHCTWCLTHQAVVLKVPPPVPFNYPQFKAILKQVPARDDPRLLARIAFGIPSPRITKMKLSQDPIFGSMMDHQFLVWHISSDCVSLNSRHTELRRWENLHFLFPAWFCT